MVVVSRICRNLELVSLKKPPNGVSGAFPIRPLQNNGGARPVGPVENLDFPSFP